MAVMDATENEVSRIVRALGECMTYFAHILCVGSHQADGLEIRGFPTFILYPLGSEQKPVEFQGELSLGDLIEFLADNIHSGGFCFVACAFCFEATESRSFGFMVRLNVHVHAGEVSGEEDFWGRRRRLRPLQEEYVEAGGQFLDRPSVELRNRLVAAMDALLAFHAEGELLFGGKEDGATSRISKGSNQAKEEL